MKLMTKSLHPSNLTLFLLEEQIIRINHKHVCLDTHVGESALSVLSVNVLIKLKPTEERNNRKVQLEVLFSNKIVH